MSTENFHASNGSGAQPAKAFAVFLALSLVIHAAIVLSASALAPLYKRLGENITAPKNEPVVVDVIELPPGKPSKEKPKKGVTRYADRTNVVEKETAPKREPLRRPSKYAGPRPAFKPAPVSNAVKAAPTVKEPASAVPKAAVKPAPAKASPTVIAKTAQNQDDDTLWLKGGTGVKKTPAPPKQTAKAGAATEAPSSLPAPAVVAPQAGQQAVNGKTQTPSTPADASQSKPARPNLFLPGEKIQELTRRYEAEAPSAEQGKTLNLNTAEFRYQNYLINSVKRRIEIYWDYPDVAVRNGWQGKVQITFTINRDGSLSNVAVIKSSGYPSLDDAAVTAIKLASPFAGFPENFAVQNLNIKGQFEYNFSHSPER